VKRTIALIALCGIVSHTLARSTFPILLPAIEDELLANHQQAGLLTTVNFGAYLAGVALVTTVSGRFEPVRLLQSGLGTAAVGFLLLATAGGFVQLAAGQMLAGMGSAGLWMSAPSIATSAAPANRRGLVMGLLSSTMGLGIFTVSQGTNAMRRVQGDDQAWRPTWWAAAVYAAVLLALVLVSLRTPPTAKISGGVSLTRLRTVPRWASLTIGYWLFGYIVASFTPFFGAALEEKGFSRAHVGNLYSLFGLAAVAGAVSLGRVSDRVGRRPVLLGSLAAMLASAVLVLTGREPFAAVAALLFGAASFTFPVLIATHLSDHLRDRALSNALGALTLLYGTALASAPFISGTVGDSSLGFDAVFAAVAVLAVGASVAIARLPRSEPILPGPAEAAPSGVGQ
jgi:MFS family permease